MSYIYGLLKSVIWTLLDTLHQFTGNFGVAIILATIIIRIILLPLTLKQDKSMKAMKKLQPEIERIKKEYKNDPQTMNMKTMELYKEHKINPAAGCLPLLLQLPILWALFGVLRADNTIPEGAKFLWLTLNQPDQYFILPIINGLVSFLQQKMSATADNPQTKNMMYIFPIMMVAISYKLPGGVQLYWVSSSIAMFIQQYLIMKKGD